MKNNVDVATRKGDRHHRFNNRLIRFSVRGLIILCFTKTRSNRYHPATANEEKVKIHQGSNHSASHHGGTTKTHHQNVMKPIHKVQSESRSDHVIEMNRVDDTERYHTRFIGSQSVHRIRCKEVQILRTERRNHRICSYMQCKISRSEMTSKQKIQNGDTNQSDDGGLHLRCSWCSSLSFRDTIGVCLYSKGFLIYVSE